jgi:hypothetical protein
VTNLSTPEFNNCANLLAIEVAPDNPAFVSVDGVVFDKQQQWLIRFPGGKAGSYTVPDGVVGLAYGAFWNCDRLEQMMIGSSVTNIGSVAFDPDVSLQDITVSPLNPVYSSRDGVLYDKDQTTLLRFPPAYSASYAIPAGTVTIGPEAFVAAALLTSVTLPASVSNFLDSAFAGCGQLASVTFLGDAPLDSNLDPYLFYGATNAILYYLPGTAGWGPMVAGRPTALWNPTLQADGAVAGDADPSGLTMAGTPNILVAVEASTNLLHWEILQFATLTNGLCHFSDPGWTNHPGRFYRLRSP